MDGRMQPLRAMRVTPAMRVTRAMRGIPAIRLIPAIRVPRAMRAPGATRATRALRACMFLLLLALAGPLSALELETPRPRQFGVLEGLPSHRIHALATDAQGYLWLATGDGLARYDGVAFRSWQVGDGLRGNKLWAVHVDARDRVWIGTQGRGASMLDAQRRRFVHYTRATHPALASDTVFAIASTPDGATWLATEGGGITRIDARGALASFRVAHGLPHDDVTALAVDGDGTLHAGTRAGVARWRMGRFVPVRGLPREGVDSLRLDARGGLWVRYATHARVLRRGDRVAPMPHRDPDRDAPALQLLLVDPTGAHWLDTLGGMARTTPAGVRDVPLYSASTRGVVRPQWTSALVDREGGLWFGSSDAGLWHLPSNWRTFATLPRRVDDPGSPANAFVHGVAEARDGGLWLVGSGGVLDWLHPRSGVLRHRIEGVCDAHIAGDVFEDRDGAVWVGCMHTLARVAPDDDVRRWRTGDAGGPPSHLPLREWLQQRDGTLWAHDGATIQARAPDGRVVATLRAGPAIGLPAGARLAQMARAPDGGVWVAGSHGLAAFNDGTRRFQRVPGAPRAAVHGFAERAGTVWLAGEGWLARMRWDGAALQPQRRFDGRDGVPQVAPGGMAVDALGAAWMTSARGLVRVDARTGRVRVYGVRDGLPSQEFADTPLRITRRGDLAIGTSDGLLLFQPARVLPRAATPTLAIDAVDVRRGEARIALPRTGAVAMRHDDRDLRVSARLLSFTDTHGHRYRTRLGDEPWNETVGRGERAFARLPAGLHLLQVQARTADGEWSPVQSLALHVQPAWWRTGWAIALATLALLATATWAALAWRTRLRRRTAWQLAQQARGLAEEASLAKTRFLATLGHEVRTPMTGVLGMSELLAGTPLDARQRGYVDAIHRAGRHLLRLVNDALDLSRIESGKFVFEDAPFDVHALVDDAIALMGPLAAQRGLAFEARVDPATPRALRGDGTRVCQMLLNLLGNAIKFTERGHVRLQVGPAPGGGLRWTVADSGPGLNDAQLARLFRRFEQADGAHAATRYGGSGLGLAICQEFAAAMGGRIDVDSTPGQGTRFTVTLPLQTAPVEALDGAHASGCGSPGIAAPQPPTGTGATDARAGTLDVLLVEDDPTVAEVLAGLLTTAGHHPVHAPHGLAALGEAVARRFDIGLLDLDLPGMDGFDLARQLRALHPAMPLVAITARTDPAAESRAAQAGFAGFVRKPVTSGMLDDALQAALRSASPARMP